MNSRIIKIATRSSPLALYQAQQVKAALENNGAQCEVVPVETTGDINLTEPIYAIGITGIFTKQLDASLLANHTDIAVHSLKDVPVELAQNLTLGATLERGPVEDVLVVKNKTLPEAAKIASSSLRRKAQWLARHPSHEVVPVRGNVQTRLRKLAKDPTLHGMIFAKAGLERLGLLSENCLTLNWMLPAAAQGAIGISCRTDDAEALELCKKINHQNTFIESSIERNFLKQLMGGCSVPIGALAKVQGDKIIFKASMHSYDGTQKFLLNEIFDARNWQQIGAVAAEKLLQQNGAVELIKIIRNSGFKSEGI